MTNPQPRNNKAGAVKDAAPDSADRDKEEQDNAPCEKQQPAPSCAGEDGYEIEGERGRLDIATGFAPATRTVNQLGNYSEDDHKDTPPPTFNIFTSKLNPNVPEFVPKSARLSGLNNNRNEISQPLGTASRMNIQFNDNRNIPIVTGRNNNADSDAACGVQNVNNNSGETKQEDLQEHRGNNAAIATFTELYTVNPEQPYISSQVANKKPIILFTPNYFLTGHVVATEVEEENNEEPSNDNANPDPSKSAETCGSQHSDCEDTAASNKLAIRNHLLKTFYEEMQILESIKKVNSWFDRSRSPPLKGPTMCFCPGAYKKKEVTWRTPISDDDENKSPSPENDEPSTPSKYVANLAREYLERAPELKPTYYVWTRYVDEYYASEELTEEEEEEESEDEDHSSDS